MDEASELDGLKPSTSRTSGSDYLWRLVMEASVLACNLTGLIGQVHRASKVNLSKALKVLCKMRGGSRLLILLDTAINSIWRVAISRSTAQGRFVWDF
jgi:hypothetical protein